MMKLNELKFMAELCQLIIEDWHDYSLAVALEEELSQDEKYTPLWKRADIDIKDYGQTYERLPDIIFNALNCPDNLSYDVLLDIILESPSGDIAIANVLQIITAAQHGASDEKLTEMLQIYLPSDKVTE